MKFLLSLLAVFLTSCSSINYQLKNAISYGEIVELNKYSQDVEKQLIVRLFRSPIYKKNCLKEIHAPCQYKYFISVSTYDENPETNIFSLSRRLFLLILHRGNARW